MQTLLNLLEKNARYTNAQLAAMCGMEEAEVAAAIAKMESDGIIRGYQAIIDWEQTERKYVRALIEVKVIPQKDYGFEEIAKAIVEFDEVEGLELMSGNYDFAVTVVAKTFKDVAMFVAHRLSPLEAVQATSTNFVLRPYKVKGFVMNYSDSDEREVASI